MAVTGGASKSDASSVILNATVNPEGQATTYYFQFGTSTAYGLQTLPVNIGSGSAKSRFTAIPKGSLRTRPITTASWPRARRDNLRRGRT